MKKRNKMIPLYDINLQAKTIKAVSDVLKSGWLSPGKNVLAFEQAVAAYLDVAYTVGVSSATDGLIVALKAFNVGAGDEVVTTPFTFVATIEAIVAVGATPVLVDIDYDSLTISIDAIKQKVSRNTKAIIPVDIAGFPCDYSSLKKLCRSNNIVLISDSAHTIGAKYKNKAIARYTDASVISFHATKNLICGEGGMICTNRKQIADKIRRIANHGLTNTAYSRKNNRYDVTEAGLKANLSELHATVGLHQFQVLTKEQLHRNRLAQRYIKNLYELQPYIQLPLELPERRHGWHLFIGKLFLPGLKITRDQFIQNMKRVGVECGVHYQPVTELSYYRRAYKLKHSAFPETTRAGKSVITLPLYPSLTFKQVDYICEQIAILIEKYRK